MGWSEIGFAVSFGVLIDTFVVRTMLDPALATLFGPLDVVAGRRAAGETRTCAGRRQQRGGDDLTSLRDLRSSPLFARDTVGESGLTPHPSPSKNGWRGNSDRRSGGEAGTEVLPAVWGGGKGLLRYSAAALNPNYLRLMAARANSIPSSTDPQRWTTLVCPYWAWSWIAFAPKTTHSVEPTTMVETSGSLTPPSAFNP